MTTTDTTPPRRSNVALTLALYTAAAFACFVAACSASGVTSVAEPAGTHARAASPSPITHIVMIDLENRSFDNMFHGFPGADSANTGKMHNGQIVTLQPLPLTQINDLGHSRKDWIVAYDNGNMDGFDLEKLIPGTGQSPPPPTYPYSYTDPSTIQPYWALASQYTLADRMFQSNGGPSYPAHFYLIAAQTDNIFGNPTHPPWGCDDQAKSKVAYYKTDGTVAYEFPCIDMPTLADLLNTAGISWKSYTPAATASFEAYESISHIRFGPQWSTNFPLNTHILNDPKHGQLASVSWVIPTFDESDHPKTNRDVGPSWVASVVNAIGESPYWNSTAIFITWDDWGGWYDHVPPQQLDKFGLGFRVPLIVVSPYARHGYVSHTQHEFGSIVRFTEETFGLPSLGQTDARADDLSDCFDFTQSPAPFVPIQSQLDAKYFLHQPPDLRPVDDDMGTP
ncbi:MAG TPA: alkaline phosphatase family protein [Candidatus Eremiobacteraceae bacterium]|jgi:phospholipase C